MTRRCSLIQVDVTVADQKHSESPRYLTSGGTNADPPIAAGVSMAVDKGEFFGHGGEMADPHNLDRFVRAQDREDSRDNFKAAVKELRHGREETHWIWFVFPQMRELGYGDTAKFFGIASRDEAVAYLAHEVLGPRLHQCSQLVARSPIRNPNMLMGGYPDDRKLQSSMTLFAEVAEDNEDFVEVLRKYYNGERDRATLKLLEPRRTTTLTTVAPETDVRPLRHKWRPWRRR